MSVLLLDKTRKISRFLHNNNSSKVVFNDICKVFTDILNSSILVISAKGKVLGESDQEGEAHISELITDRVGDFIDPELNERFLLILSTKENVDISTLGFSEESAKGIEAIVTPIDIAGERLGTLFLYRKGKPYDIDDIILSEYGTTVVGLEMMRAVNEEKSDEIRKHQVVKSAVRTLSVSEQEALLHVFSVLQNNEGTVVASKIADEAGVARSVLVNALKKFESAGIIETRSSGMKGTYIKVRNDEAKKELMKAGSERA